jgi:gamma-glutamylputrescine oxidase
MFSYWEYKTWLEDIDFCIIGSGIVGLSAALHLRRLQPHARIALLERSPLPNGASTKNAGFACFGSLSELAADLKKSTFSEVLHLVEKRYNGFQLLRRELGDDAIELNSWGGYEMFRADDAELYSEALSIMNDFNKELAAFIPGKDVYSDASHKIADFGFSHVKSMIFNRAEGQIHTGKMMDALIRKVHESKIILLFGLPVKQIIEDVRSAKIITDAGPINAQKVIIATNGFATQFLPDLNVRPARAQVLVTSKIENLPFKGTFHIEEGYYYFRNIGNRVLFGGGRNLDYEGETTTSHETTSLIQNQLEHMLRKIILPEKNFTIDYRWAGTMGLGDAKYPIVKQISESVYCAVRMGGMGVALGSATGKDIAELAAV